MKPHRKTTPRARALREELTPAEDSLWLALRGRRLAGFKIRRQHPIRGFFLDFYCHEARLGIEVDGGGHADPDQRCLDEERSRILEAHGIRIVRFWNHEVLGNREGVLRRILELLEERSRD